MEVGTGTGLKNEEIEKRFLILRYKVNELEIEKVWTEFTRAGFEPILIKGWAASRLYPEPFRRQFTDVDLLIAPESYRSALEFSKTLPARLPVDLHEGARHLDSVDFRDLFAHCVTEKCGETEIRVLRPEDHLRILCIHWLTDGGAYREKLWDIYYAVSRRPPNFDWERVLDVTTERRRRWIICTIGLAEKYLNLEIEDTPIAADAGNLPAWLTTTVENEWSDEVRSMPLELFLKDKKMLWKQIRKRIPPNPIQATVLEEGDFDGKGIFFYQIKNMFSRLLPSIHRFRRKKNIQPG